MQFSSWESSEDSRSIDIISVARQIRRKEVIQRDKKKVILWAGGGKKLHSNQRKKRRTSTETENLASDEG